MSEITSSTTTAGPTKSIEEILKEIKQYETEVKYTEDYIEEAYNDAKKNIPLLEKLNIVGICIFGWILIIILILITMEKYNYTLSKSTTLLILFLFNIHFLFSMSIGLTILYKYYAPLNGKLNVPYQDKYDLVHFKRKYLIQNIHQLYKQINKTDVSEIVSDNHIKEFEKKYNTVDTKIIPDEFIRIAKVNTYFCLSTIVFLIILDIYFIVYNSKKKTEKYPNGYDRERAFFLEAQARNNNEYLDISPADNNNNNNNK